MAVRRDGYRLAMLSDAETPEPRRVFASLDAFVSEYLTRVFQIDPSRNVHAWCPDWWRHPEAVVRLSAMWEAFEYARGRDSSSGVSQWHLDSAPLHLSALRDPKRGPFSRCSPVDGHVDAVVPMKAAAAPGGFWTGIPAFSVYTDTPDSDPDADPDSDDYLPLAYESLEEFVVLYVAAVFQTDPESDVHAWCPYWWKHAEAVTRLAAMWHAYERYHHRPAEMSTWLLRYADPALDLVRDPVHGPFAGCAAAGRHVRALIDMPVIPLPPGVRTDTHGGPLFAPPAPGDDAL
ncbi:MAG: DUF4913 domain-containing protein [Streptomycetaceae bacterium]|nr:DUF4913 domain-containing protein [Streptomycetaceae bacterium]